MADEKEPNELAEAPPDPQVVLREVLAEMAKQDGTRTESYRGIAGGRGGRKTWPKPNPPPPLDGKALQMWRLRLGYTQESMAELLGVREKRWIKWEKGRSTIPPWLRSLVWAVTDLRVRAGTWPMTQQDFNRATAPLLYGSKPSWHVAKDPPSPAKSPLPRRVHATKTKQGEANKGDSHE